MSGFIRLIRIFLVVIIITSNVCFADDLVNFGVRQSGSAVLDTSEAAKIGLEYLELADASYNEEISSVGNWRRVGSAVDLINDGFFDKINNKIDELVSGFSASIYENKETYEIVIAFAGTDPQDLRDIMTDFNEIRGADTTQYELATAIAEAAAEKYGSVTFVGHSLGGGLAQQAVLTTNQKGVVFNALGSSYLNFNSQDFGDNLIAFNSKFDFAANSGFQAGTEYKIPKNDNLLNEHSLDSLKKRLIEIVSQNSNKQAVDWARVQLAQGRAVSIISNNVSHIGSCVSSSVSTQGSSYNTGQSGLFVSNSPLAESQFFLIAGNSLANLGYHGTSFGTLLSPTGSNLFSVNNAGMDIVIIEKYFILQSDSIYFNFSGLASFVTNEYPEWVGSKFNDVGKISFITPGGKVLSVPMLETVNESTFTPVSGLPYPMASYGGATSFKKISSKIITAPGSQITLRIEVDNVGDQAVPSAIVLDSLKAR